MIRVSIAFLLALGASLCGMAHAGESGEGELRQPAVVVTGTREEQAQAFVQMVQPKGWQAASRGVPRWDSEICISVIGPPVAQGQFIADRISQRAMAVGLEAGAPGCETNLLVIVTDDPAGLLPVVAEKHRGIFGFSGDANIDTGGSGTSLASFIDSDLPVRWRQVIRTVGADGDPLDGDPMVNASDKGQQDPLWKNAFRDLPINRTESTRLRSTVRRELSCVVAVVNTNQTAGLGIGAIADYLAFVTLADVGADADLTGFPSILNLFNPQAEQLTGLSDWDVTFLEGLYSASLDAASSKMHYREIARRMAE